jgi:hypothetical protein
LRAPVKLALDLRRLNGDALSVSLLFPDEISALTLKAFATRVRMKPTDIVDVWRCLEICLAAGADFTDFRHGERAEGAVRPTLTPGRRSGKSTWRRDSHRTVVPSCTGLRRPSTL